MSSEPSLHAAARVRAYPSPARPRPPIPRLHIRALPVAVQELYRSVGRVLQVQPGLAERAQLQPEFVAACRRAVGS